MKTIRVSLLALAAIAICTGSALAADWQPEYARLLAKYVTPAGVKYAAWKASAADMQAIQSVVAGIATEPASTAKSKEQLAFLMNAYNAWILHEALAKYPTKSVKDALFTFFMGKRITVAGEKMSFNRLEKDIIRPRFNEPRIHFALNCASQSCPPLRAEPYAAAKLETQLEEQTRAYLNEDRGVKVSGDTAQLSKIFDWYKEDFGGDAGVRTFIPRYRGGKPVPKKVTYQEYDWSLNEAK
jgi:Protein of unknown function, DUF547